MYQEAVDLFINNLKVLDRSPETISSYTKDLRYIKDFLEEKYNGCIYIEDVKQADFESFLLHQKERGLATASRSRNLYTMRSFAKYLYNSGLIKINPAANIGNIKVKNKERQVVNKEEVYRLYQAIEHKTIRVMVLFLYFTGLRISEATSLTLENTKIDDGIIKVVSGKGNKDRIVPLNNEIKTVLSDYINYTRPKNLQKNYLFATEKTGEVSNQYVNRQIKLALKKANIDKDISCHSLRHSYSISLVKKNVNIVHISQLLGHSSVKTTSIYTNNTDIDDLKESVALL